MRFLADECLHAGLVGWLRSASHDVLYAVDDLAGATDEALLLRARNEDRIVVTDDKDFGDLVVHGQRSTAGVLLLRLHGVPLADRIARLDALWPQIEPRLRGHLVVVGERKVRSRPLPSGTGD